ncbi:MAG: DUF6084 family protein [Acidimicrobiales bacterium]
MAELGIEVLGVRAEPYAAVPTLTWSVRFRESTGARVHTIALHAQVRIEPQLRRYEVAQRDRLQDMFGEPSQWGESLRPFLWTHLDTMVSGFDGELVVDVPMSCTYDFEVAGSKYLHALDEGEIPVVFLWSGTMFTKGDSGFSAELVPWHLESRYRLPVTTWRELMDAYYPGGGWLRLDRETIDRLQRYRTEQALPTWEQAIAALFKAAGEDS